MSSHERDYGSSRGKQPADDYFSRRIVPHISWTGDLIRVDSNEHGDTLDDSEGRNRNVELLSPVESQLLTPATLTPPVENAETSPLLPARSGPTTAYASTDMPVVCCRAGPRPANVASDNYGNSAPFQNRPAESMTRSIYYRRTGHDLEQNKVPPFRHRRRRSGRHCNSKYLHRWVLALSLMACLFILQYLCLEEDASESSCTLPYCSDSLTHAFDNITDFSFSEDLQIAGLSVRGAIRLESALEDQESQVSVVVSYAASRSWRASPQWELSDNSIRLQAPTLAKQGRSFLPRIFDPCLSISATIYLGANMTLQTFQIDTTHMSITSSPGLFSRPQTLETKQSKEEPHPNINLTTLQTTSRPITLPHWASRRTILHTTSSAIAGTFTHLELVSLTTSSGSITASITPGEAEPSNPAPAALKIKTASGSVRLTYPSIEIAPSSSSSSGEIPARDYQTLIQTSSGSIEGTILFSSTAELTSNSGSIRAEMLYAPLSSSPAPSIPANTLKTSTHSGLTEIHLTQVHSSNKDLPTKLKPASLRSSHGIDSSSGSIKVRYPAEWEGGIKAESGGRVKVGGEGVVVDREERVGGRARVRAHKGMGEGGENGGGGGSGDWGSGNVVEARSGSGGVEVFVGGI